MRETFSAHHAAALDRSRVDHFGEDATVGHLARFDGVAREQEPTGQHRAEPVEEEVQRAERRAEEARCRHTDLRVARHHRNVRHEGELEAASERIARDLSDRRFRIPEQ